MFKIVEKNKMELEEISKKNIEDALSKAEHPEISYSLVELGMIKDIKVKGAIVSVTLMLPLLDIPVKEDLIDLIKGAVKKLGKDIRVKIKTAEMDEKEKEKFMKLAREGWKV